MKGAKSKMPVNSGPALCKGVSDALPSQAPATDHGELALASQVHRAPLVGEGRLGRFRVDPSPASKVSPRPFRLTAPEPPERDLQASVVAALDALLARPHAFSFSAAIGACQLSPQQAAALSRAGVKRGLPDLFVVANGGRLYGIELKVRGGQLSKSKIVRTRSGAPRELVGQRERFAELGATGVPIAVCRSVNEVVAQLEAWRIPLRGRVAS